MKNAFQFLGVYFVAIGLVKMGYVLLLKYKERK